MGVHAGECISSSLIVFIYIFFERTGGNADELASVSVCGICVAVPCQAKIPFPLLNHQNLSKIKHKNVSLEIK